MALVQACQDARRAYRNWFDSLSGKRKGRKVGHPRFRSRKDHRQSIRLTRNGFALHGDRLYVAKVGDLKVQWSRALPSVPSSGHGDPRGGRPVLRLVRCRGGRHAAPSDHQRHRPRPRAEPRWPPPRTGS